jgi:hypothetical protein
LTEPGPEARRGRERALLLLALAVGAFLLLRVVEAREKSLWIDELHTVHIAAGAGPGEVLERLRPDFHAPLHFLAAHAVRGIDPHAQRAISILGGIALLWVLLRLGRRAGLGGPAQAALAAAAAGLPFQIQYGTELRPYAWLGAISACFLAAAFTPAPRPGRWILTLALLTALGLYTHYLFAVVLVAAGAVRLVLAGGARPGLGGLVLGGTLGVLLFLPWVAYDESWILEDPGVMLRDESDIGESVPPTLMGRVREAWPQLRADLVSLPLRLALPSVGRLGPRAGPVAAAGVLVLLLVPLPGLLRRRRGAGPGAAPEAGPLGPVLAASVLAMLLVTALSVVVWQRVALQYLSVGAAALPILVALGVEGFRSPVGQRRAAALVLAAAVVGGAGHVLGAPREDLRAGVAAVQRLAAGREAIVTAVLRQPAHYSALSVYEVYAPGIVATPPLRVPPASGTEPRPVIVLTRNAPIGQPEGRIPIWGDIRSGRSVREQIVIDPAVVVYLLEPGRPR